MENSIQPIQSNEFENSVKDIANGIEQIPGFVVDNITKIRDLSRKVEKADERAKGAVKAANKMKGFEEKHIMLFNKEIVKWKSGDIKEIVKEHQDISKSIADALEANSEALSLFFDFQKQLAQTVEALFSQGCYDLAHNEAMIKSIEDQLRNSKKTNNEGNNNPNGEKRRLSDIAQEEFLKLAKRLKQQQNILLAQERLKKKISEYGKEIKELQIQRGNLEKKQIEFISESRERVASALVELEKKHELDIVALHQEYQSKFTAIQKTADENAEQLRQFAAQLSKDQTEFISESRERVASALVELEKKHELDIVALHQEYQSKFTAIQKTADENAEQLRQSTDQLSKDQAEFISESRERIFSALTELKKKYEADIAALHQEWRALQKSIEDSKSELSQAVETIKENQAKFIEKSKLEAEKKYNEMQQASISFEEKQSMQFQKMKKQVTFYKIISLFAIVASIASLIFSILQFY